MNILDKLAKSKFRSRFKLRSKELEYIKDKGLDTIYSHACDFIRDRVAPAEPTNDGKQTPMRGHPVFIAQHATAPKPTISLSRSAKPEGVPRAASGLVALSFMFL